MRVRRRDHATAIGEQLLDHGIAPVTECAGNENGIVGSHAALLRRERPVKTFWSAEARQRLDNHGAASR
jgi:hypothetical protein